MLFAHLKRILKLDRLRLRGPCGARDEFHLAAAAQNLRRMAKLIGTQAARDSLKGDQAPLACKCGAMSASVKSGLLQQYRSKAVAASFGGTELMVTSEGAADKGRARRVSPRALQAKRL